jgi:hypothetical protein
MLIFGNVVCERSYLTEVNFPATGSVLRGAEQNFPDLELVKGKPVTAIDSITRSQLSRSPDNAPTVTNATVITGVATFFVLSTKQLNQYPCYSLTSSLNNGILRQFDYLLINWVKSSVQLFDAGITAGDSFVFNIFYMEKMFRQKSGPATGPLLKGTRTR